MTDTAAPAPEPETPALGPKRSSRTARDMALSMIVLLIPLALVVAVFRARGGEDVVVVDPGPAIAQARAAGAFPVAAPTGLDPRWRPVSAGFATAAAGGATLRIGYVTPEGGAVQLIESSEPADGLLIRELGDDVRPVATMPAGSANWDSYLARDSERALVLKQTDRTSIVIGQASFEELATLAAALR